MTSTTTSAVVNTRDLGGLIIEHRGRIPHGVLYRSELPLSGDPAPDLHPRPPAVICDLRSATEHIGQHPLTAGAATVLHTALSANPDPVRTATEADDTELGQIYDEMLTSDGDTLVRIAEAVATTTGSTLVHCAAGKDRAG
jgi:protein-tyrosine phosphatase